MSTNIAVCARVRPLNSAEKKGDVSSCVTVSSPGLESKYSQSLQLSSLDGNKESFSFTCVLGETAAQQDVYNAMARPAVAELLAGKNAALYFYGETGAGKTYTMQGTSVAKGIAPRVVDAIFSHVMASENSVEFSICASYYEVCNEKIRDLLDSEKNNLSLVRAPSGTWQDEQRAVAYVSGATEVYVTSAAELNSLMAEGAAARSASAAETDKTSFRSHGVCSITLSQVDTKSGVALYSKLLLVDFAGSEMMLRRKASLSNNTTKEPQNVNKSLSALGNVVNILSQGDVALDDVPFRDSKLTDLLEDSLVGNSVTRLILCLSPSANSDYETLNTLRFGSRAKCIKTIPRTNTEYSRSKLMEKLTDQEQREQELTQLLKKSLAEIEKLKSANRSESKGQPSGEGASEKMGAQTASENLDTTVGVNSDPGNNTLEESCFKNADYVDGTEENGPSNSQELSNSVARLKSRNDRLVKENNTLKHELMEAEQKWSDCTEELENANRVQSQMIQKLSKDSESMMNLQMELDSATHKISELMNSAPEYLKSQVQKEQHKQAKIGENYSVLIQENSTLRREVEVLEHLLLKYQNELAKAKIELSRSENASSAATTDGTSGSSSVVTRGPPATSPHRFRKAIKGGTSPKKSTEKEAFSGQIIVPHGKKYEHVVRPVQNGEVSWEFTLGTSAADVGFTVVYDGIPVRAYTRCKSNGGTFAPGKMVGNSNKSAQIVLVFDNSFSIFRDKTINLVVRIKTLPAPRSPPAASSSQGKKSTRRKKKRTAVID